VGAPPNYEGSCTWRGAGFGAANPSAQPPENGFRHKAA